VLYIYDSASSNEAQGHVRVFPDLTGHDHGYGRSGALPSLHAFYVLPPQFTGGVRVGYSSDFEGRPAS
jgi:hypothetical protein